SPIIFDKLFITLNIDDDPLDDVPVITSMSLFSYFYKTNYTGTQVKFNSSMSGNYTVVIDLPTEYDFELYFPSSYVVVDGHGFYIANSIIPRKFEFTVTIIESSSTDDWGQRLIVNYVIS
ncbi:MAG TPA: hypothetical protein PK087_03065, partial [Bacilli bacterium]|nr:hypothetical protein [Bacilli bacterium]